MLFKAQSNEERRQLILNGKVINTLLFLFQHCWSELFKHLSHSQTVYF